MKRLSMCAESIRAIRAGAKDLTTRAVKPQPVIDTTNPKYADWLGWWPKWAEGECIWRPRDAALEEIVRCAPYHVGERVALTETWCTTGAGCVLYKADNRTEQPYWSMLRWSPARFMRAEDARYYATILTVASGLLWDMTDADYRREGVETLPWYRGDLRAAWMTWWNKLNGKRCPAASNPWVWVLEFKEVNQ